jgi:proteasome lid subunit RPN8/RPN11
MEERIRFGAPIEPSIPVEKFPPDFLLIDGQSKIQKNSFQIYIVQKIYNQIWKHVNSSMEAECGGVLVGHPFKSFDNTITYVVISAFIPQPSTKRGIAHFTVGPEEVAYTRSTLNEKYTGLVIVGWYHSHPGHGVFLSGQDMTIVRSIYNLGWHLAMVLDPIHKNYGFFYGANGSATSNIAFLSKEPAFIKAIALYNQFKLLTNKQDGEILSFIDIITSLVENNVELNHWKTQGKYQDLQLKVSIIDNQEYSEPVIDLPSPARRNKPPLNASQIITYIFIPTLLTIGFVVTGIFSFKLSDTIAAIMLGLILSLVIVYGVIFPLNSDGVEKPKNYSRLMFISAFLFLIALCYWVFIGVLIWKADL